MALILSIETATPVCSVALQEGDQLLGEYTLLKERSHSGKLAILIERLLEDCSRKFEDLAAVAVSEGPGSYTGLRIGVSTAKGLCYALNIPLIAVNSLTAIANRVKRSADLNSYLIPMFDARRMEVYCQVLTAEMEVIQKTMPLIIEEGSLVEYLSKMKCYFFGDGAEKTKSLIQHANAFFVDEIYPSAASVGELAFGKYKVNEFEDVAYFEPFYLKEYRAGKPKSLV